jgi:hypothetical protein
MGFSRAQASRPADQLEPLRNSRASLNPLANEKTQVLVENDLRPKETHLRPKSSALNAVDLSVARDIKMAR